MKELFTKIINTQKQIDEINQAIREKQTDLYQFKWHMLDLQGDLLDALPADEAGYPRSGAYHIEGYTFLFKDEWKDGETPFEIIPAAEVK